MYMASKIYDFFIVNWDATILGASTRALLPVHSMSEI